VDKFEPVSCCGEMEHSEEAVGEFVVSSGDGTVDFEMTDHALDAVALAIEALVPSDCRLAVGARWDDGPDSASLEVGSDGIAVIALVSEHGLGRMLRQVDQRFVGRAVRRFAACEVEGERSAAGISETMNLTGEPAPRAAKSLFASPPFAPAAETWPRTVVESML
jgi:hypothetical protein